jgi:hypothetical protein
MLVRKLVVGVLLGSMTFAAFAADWQVIADTDLGQLRLDADSIVRQEPYTAATLVYQFSKSQRQTDPPKEAFNRRRDGVLIDCATRSLGLAEAVFFDDEKLVDSRKKELANVKFAVATPDTMAEKVVNAVCAHDTNKH